MCVTTILGTCILATQLTAVDISTNKRPLIDTASAYDGVSRDVSKFYTPKDSRIAIGGDIYTKDMKISLGYNNGTKTEKYEVNDALAIQVTKHMPLSENWSTNITGGTVIGGNESHTSCSDDYNRKYYCGDLTAWSDFDEPDNKTNWNVGISFTYKF